jgi:transporter
MKKFLLVSFVLSSIYGFSAKVNTSKNNTSVTGNKTKNIGKMTI